MLCLVFELISNLINTCNTCSTLINTCIKTCKIFYCSNLCLCVLIHWFFHFIFVLYLSQFSFQFVFILQQFCCSISPFLCFTDVSDVYFISFLEKIFVMANLKVLYDNKWLTIGLAGSTHTSYLR